ncbi:MAG: T9SS type A sorting domain-containing protein [Bacteroidetes bacterium]|nr:T9SS type A sorting domain-containing protein [Bacteroidota bacterium]
MKKLLLLPLFFCLTLFSYGTHLMGSDMSYVCLGQGKYELTVRVYRDCNGIPISQSNVVGSCSSNSITISTQTQVSVRDVTGVGSSCPIQSRCAGSAYQYGVEEHTWKMTVDLSTYSCCEWTFSWSQSARNSAITTGQAGQNFYTTATINKCVAPCNSSPTYDNLPIRFLCYNQDVNYNMGVVDTIDAHDSFSYTLVHALTGANAYATYSGNFAPERPLTFFGFPNQNLLSPAGFHLNPVTGNLSFRPTQVNQVAVIVVEVTEWRKVNGIMTVIGKTRRDMQVIVVTCAQNQKPPSISVPDEYQVCAGDSISLPFPSIDPNTMDSTFIEAFHSIPGASFTSNNGQSQNAAGYFHWRTDSTMIANSPYFLTVQIRDNNCPLNLEFSKTFVFYVTDSAQTAAFYAGPDIHIQRQDTIRLMGSDSFNYGQKAQWQSDGDGRFVDPNATQAFYILGPMDKKSCQVTMIRSPKIYSFCGTNHPDTMTLWIDPGYMQVGFDSSIINNGDSVVLKGNYMLDTSYRFQWSGTGDGLFSDPQSVQTTYTFGSSDSSNCSVWLYLEANSAEFCQQYKDSLLARVRTNDSLKIGFWINTPPDTINLTHTLSPGHYIHWRGGGGKWFVDSVTFNARYVPTAAEKSAGFATILANGQVFCQVFTDSIGIPLVPTGMSETSVINGLKFYPNPVNSDLFIQGVPIHSQIEVYDITGRLMLRQSAEEEEVVKVNVRHIETGTYLVRVLTPEGTAQSRLISIK